MTVPMLVERMAEIKARGHGWVVYFGDDCPPLRIKHVGSGWSMISGCMEDYGPLVELTYDERDRTVRIAVGNKCSGWFSASDVTDVMEASE